MQIPVTYKKARSDNRTVNAAAVRKTGRAQARVAGRLTLVAMVVFCALTLNGCHTLKPMPPGTSFSGEEHVTYDVAFLADRTWVDQSGNRHVDQVVFDEMFALIDGARRIILLDMFLYNDWQGPVPETTRALSGELTERLLRARKAHPHMPIVVITDPVNTLYNGLSSAQFESLEAAGVQVIETDLNKLRDSNTFYSPFWRLFFKPFGNDKGSLLPNPIGPGRVSLRTYMKLLNFKANHRKTLVVDRGDRLVGFVSSANPHDGSSAHRNAAIRFDGPAVDDLIVTENAILELSGRETVNLEPFDENTIAPAAPVTVQIVTEEKIEQALLSSLAKAQRADRVDLMMFYLSDRHVLRALKDAHERGARLRIMLDPNKDAFGREKNGVPNRPVAHTLTREGIDVRWCNSQGEQCHAKMIIITLGNQTSILISGSANFTRRNLDDFNLETDVVLRGPSGSRVMVDAQTFFDDMWNNEQGRLYSTDYESYRDASLWHRLLGWFMEASGMSSF